MSFTVTVSVVTVLPSAATTLGDATKDDEAPLMLPATKVTVAVAVKPPTVAVTVLPWAVVEVSVAVNVPIKSVVPEAGANVLFCPVLASTTFWLATGLPLMSCTTKLRVETLLPSAVTVLGLAENVVVALAGAPATKRMLVLSVAPSTVALTAFTPARVELKVVVKMPLLLVVPDADENVLARPVAAMVTVEPTTGTLLALRTVTVMVVVLLPSAVSDVGLAAMVELEVLTTGMVYVMFAVVLIVPATSAVMVFVSTVEEANVAVNTPEALVLPTVEEKMLVEPVDDKDTD